MNKHGQTEIIGLAFVIMLAVIGLLFYVSLSNNEIRTPDIREEQLAGSMITAMINTDLQDGKYIDLIRDCAARSRNCDMTRDYSEQMLSILDLYGQPYWYRVEGTTVEIQKECDASKETVAVATQQITLFGGSEYATIILSLCRKL